MCVCVCVCECECVCQNPLWCLFAISMTEHTAASQDKLGQHQLCRDGAADIWHLLYKPLKTSLYQKLSGVKNSLCAFYPDLGFFLLYLFSFLSCQKSTKCVHVTAPISLRHLWYAMKVNWATCLYFKADAEGYQYSKYWLRLLNI